MDMFNVPSGAPAGDGAAPADDIDDLLGMPSQREGPSGGDDDADDAEKKPGSGLDLDALFAAPAETTRARPPGRTTTGGATSTTTR